MKRITLGLSAKEMREAAKQIREYRDDLSRRCERLCQRLCEEGILIAKSYIGESSFGKYIRLESELSPEKTGCKAVFYMEDTQKIISQWQNLDGEQSKEISPSLMIEFGAGLPAENPANIPGVGTGTYGSHGSDPGGWYYKDLAGVWHHANGTAARLPMYYAGKDLTGKVEKIAKEVFT